MHVALGVGATRDCKAQKLEFRIVPNTCVRIETGKHDRTDLHPANAAFAIELHCQCLCGKFVIGNMWKDCAGIDIHTMSAGRLDGGNPCLVELASQISSLTDPICEIGFVKSLI